jgi:hypothetical protein
MFVHAMREMMLGMKVNMLENRIQFEPRIAESLNVNPVPMIFDYTVHAINSRGNFQVVVDSYQRKISVTLKDWKGQRPEFLCSSSYGINVS